MRAVFKNKSTLFHLIPVNFRAAFSMGYQRFQYASVLPQGIINITNEVACTRSQVIIEIIAAIIIAKFFIGPSAYY
jgi:hypothetical protein